MLFSCKMRTTKQNTTKHLLEYYMLTGLSKPVINSCMKKTI